MPRYSPDNTKQLFKLNGFGEIQISGVGRIVLAGLDEEKASARIGLEPLLQDYDINVLLLPIQQFGVAELEPFGYDLFDQMPTQLSPDASMPVPSDYVMGPGDQVQIQLLGKENSDFLLQVSRNGTLSLPGIGVFSVAGLSFDELKRDIKKRIKKQFIGVDAFITLGELRSIRVFVLGEVNNPGAYSVSGLATITNGLLFGEGIKDIGSLRHITLKRSGETVGVLDLYQLLLHGNTQNDQRLLPGDVIHVPTIQRSVSISGEIRRPAIYELKGEQTVSDVIVLAGGLMPTAKQGNLQIVRVGREGKRLIELDLTDTSAQAFVIKSGDIITVDAVLDRQENVVYLKGEVVKTAQFQWTPALRVSDVISSLLLLRNNADAEYIVIKRYLPPEYKLEVVSTNLKEVLFNLGSDENIKLQPRDELVVFSMNTKRILQVAPIVEQLAAQASSTTPSQTVQVSGKIRGPGRYPLERGMRISDLVNAGGRLSESAYLFEAELTRLTARPGEPRKVTLLTVNLHDAMAGKIEADLLLQPHDLLNIKEIPFWQETDTIELVGEILFPGDYTIQPGESLREVLLRAGGLTPFSYPQGAVFIREYLREREQERLDAMATNLESELAIISLQRSGDPSQIQGAGVAGQLLTKLKGTEAAGRLVINLRAMLESDSPKHSVLLRGGDKLYIPSQMQEISVMGQVFHPTSHLYSDDLSVDNYIDLSGGMTRSSDDDSIYVVRANGAVQSVSDSWIDDDFDLLPGDTIVVPLDADRVSTLKLWTDVSQIVYQLGLSAAAWNTVGLFGN